MEISELKIFLAVAQQGNISRAAEELHYVQSNVTARIKQLEERLGTILFYRKSKGVTLTPAGYLLLDYARRIIRLTREAENAVSHQGVPRGLLQIGSMETAAAVRLPPLLAAYHKAYPDVELNLLTAPSALSLKRLLDYQIEGALVAGAVDQPSLLAEQVFEEELVVVTPLGSAPLEQEDLKILVFRSGCSYRAQLERWLAQCGRQAYRVVEFGSIEAITACVAAGMGISFLPRSLVQRSDYLHNCTLHKVPDEFGRMVTWFVRRRNEKSSPALQAFRDLLLEV